MPMRFLFQARCGSEPGTLGGVSSISLSFVHPLQYTAISLMACTILVELSAFFAVRVCGVGIYNFFSEIFRR